MNNTSAIIGGVILGVVIAIAFIAMMIKTKRS